MKIRRHLSFALLSVVAVLGCSINGHAAGFADTMHFTDDYPACSFSPVDAQTGNPVKDVFALAQWYKDVTVMEYATKQCAESHRVRTDGPTFPIPAVRCSGVRHGTTLSVRVKASGYQMKEFRILRRPKRSDPTHHNYLPIKDCGKQLQRLPLEKIGSLSEVLEQYKNPYNRRQMAAIFGSTATYHEAVMSEIRSFDPGIDVAGARKLYCGVAGAHQVEAMEPYCRGLEKD